MTWAAHHIIPYGVRLAMGKSVIAMNILGSKDGCDQITCVLLWLVWFSGVSASL